MSALRIDRDACIGCRLCSKSCPFGALSIVEKKAVCDEQQCTLCRSCISVCPVKAIELTGEVESARDDLQDYHGIWVFAEQWKGNLHTCAGELLTEGRRLAADLGESLTAVVLGHELGDEKDAVLSELLSFGADEVLVCDMPELAILEECRYSEALTQLIRARKPAVVLYGATTFGRGFAPMVAAKVQTGLTADCTRLEINKETGLLEQTRPAFGGNVMATIVCKNHRPQMATVRPGVFQSEALAAEQLQACAQQVSSVTIDTTAFAQMPQILGMEENMDNAVRLEEAEVIFAGGAGFEDRESFAVLEQAAAHCKAVVGASRGAVDAGYATHHQQVGQTGTVVSPKLYVAAAISGAIQHVIGMQNAECIIAINNDPDAPIFQVADLGIVGDAKKAMEYLTSL